jgi:hypothetical protein
MPLFAPVGLLGGFQVLIPPALGTAIGNMTGSGGLAASFDGNTTQAAAACSAGSGLGTSELNYIGKTFTGKKRFSKAVIYGSADGFYLGADPNVTLKARGKNGAAPSGPTDGTVIGTASFVDTSGPINVTIVSTNTVEAWDHIFFSLLSDYAGNIGQVVGEARIFEDM